MFQARPLLGFFRKSRSALTAVLLSLIFFIPVISASATLHKFFHGDGGADHHSCLACAYAKGQINTAEAAAIAVSIVLALIAFFFFETSSLQPSDIRLSPCRAPPIL